MQWTLPDLEKTLPQGETEWKEEMLCRVLVGIRMRPVEVFSKQVLAGFFNWILPISS